MIKTSMQLKALVRNKSKGDSNKSLVIIRNYAMERFLERVSISNYRDSIILKGGVLIASIIGSDKRSTMDIDVTIRDVRLDEKTLLIVIKNIISIKLPDNMKFEVVRITRIIEEAVYSGVRVSLSAMIDNMKIPLKLDFSTGDIITPAPIEYSYQLMFENRKISILAYNIETVLAEKFEAIITQGVLNTRMRDFYDIYVISIVKYDIDYNLVYSALSNTSINRKTSKILNKWNEVLDEIKENDKIIEHWENYQKKFDYVQNISWSTVINTILELGKLINKKNH